MLAKKAVCESIPCDSEIEVIKRLSELGSDMSKIVSKLETADKKASALSGKEQADAFHGEVIPVMEELRAAVDEAEKITSEEYWPVPCYGDLIFRV